ncbi:acyl transferase domain-containing protein [Xylariales sp. AK1849]|nr:acyl transferase domain-containing protein [Xylariales sp. AK1849]
MASHDEGLMAPVEVEIRHGGSTALVPVTTYIADVMRDLSIQFSEHSLPTFGSTPAAILLTFISFISSNCRPPRQNHSQIDDLLHQLLKHFETNLLRGNDIHVLTSSPGFSVDERHRLLNMYYAIKKTIHVPSTIIKSALFRAATHGDTRIFALFGGQGNTRAYLDELRNLLASYRPLIEDLIVSVRDHLAILAQHPSAAVQFPYGLDVVEWLNNPNTTPSSDYVISAPVSFPLIGLLQFVDLKALLMQLELSPAELPSVFSGFNGHSQGLVVAAAAATATSWEEYQTAVINAVTMLFWMGVRSQQAFHDVDLLPCRTDEIVKRGIGNPSPMLAISNIQSLRLDHAIKQVNEGISVDEQVATALVNGPNTFIVSGPRTALAALSDILHSGVSNTSQHRIPFSQRKSSPSVSFLPVTAPFHSKLLTSALLLVQADLEGIQIHPSSLKLLVNQSLNGESFNTLKTANIVPDLVRMVITDPVSWPNMLFPQATHIIDFGPGGTHGAGVLTHRNLRGKGTRVVISGTVHDTKSGLGSRVELLNSAGSSMSLARSWQSAYRPALVRTAGGIKIDTKLSRLLGLPPFIIAGMTPTTCDPGFVAAAMQAGFHVEFASGGYTNSRGMTAALESVRESMPAGRKIAVNVIYINPKAIAWQIPMVKQLRANGFPISSITIGAGIPSLDVATEYISTLGLEYISFKPGSVEGIYNVLEIARANPHFPVVIQWTGGRGGGHHSLEDFHQPILDTYHNIRQCDNITLVAGSGFGSADQMYPYLTGAWSVTRGTAALMPFDGILLGSRVMTCKEARTSTAVKACITAAEGVADSEWERTLKSSHGGIISVTSEMGEAIHVVATRGSLFWDEMDRNVFSVDKSKQAQVINSMRQYIIKKLNEDFQKVWFGQKIVGSGPKACELEEMTYVEVLRRIVQLMFIESRCRWIHDSYWRIFRDFLVRTEERHAPPDATTTIATNIGSNSTPWKLVKSVLAAYPEADETLLTTEDVHYFLHVCRRPGQKPVPFVPALDGNFETWFKKDSLWQSENLEAVADQDAGRTFILQGPVAVQSSSKVDETVEDVMDLVNDRTKSQILDDLYYSDHSKINCEEYLRPMPDSVASEDMPSRLDSLRNSDATSFDISSLTQTKLLLLLAGQQCSWRSAFFTHPTFVQGRSFVENPICSILSVLKFDSIQMLRSSSGNSDTTTITMLQNNDRGEAKPLISIEHMENLITVSLLSWICPKDEQVPLILVYEYQPENGFAPIVERITDRHERIYNFYERLWIGASLARKISAHDTDEALYAQMTDFEEQVIVDESAVRKFIQATGYRSTNKRVHVPLDFSIVLGWKSITRALLQRPAQGDLLRLVHLSNQFEVIAGATPLDVGDHVEAIARINSIVLESNGKVVQIVCQLSRNKRTVVKITSRFLIRGSFEDWTQTFSSKEEDPYAVQMSSPKDVSVLVSKSWFRMERVDTNLLDTELVFKLHTVEQRQLNEKSSRTTTTGVVFSSGDDVFPIAHVEYSSVALRTNPVIAYLSRWGKPLQTVQKLERPMTLPCSEELTVPDSNETYSRASGDFNPIHTSAAFAAYAGLPGTITHGMFCSAKARYVLERYAAEGDSRRITSYGISFVGMILPADVLVFSLQHTGMFGGLKVIRVEVSKRDSGEKVLVGEALVKQPPTAIIFTGQGSQEKSMGMDLYEKSAVARDVWDRCDAYFESQFGFRISTIVRENPTELTVHFGGLRGCILRQNYMNMTYEVPIGSNGTTTRKGLFPEVDKCSTSYRFSYPEGLLFATQFVQPALAIMEIAAFRDLTSRGLIPPEAQFAGHSLGEYVALTAVTDLLPLDKLMYLVFRRGLTMQVSVERDHLNRSSFGMVAVDPSRVSRAFTDATLRQIVQILNMKTGFFIEIVNFNVRNSQYVCAGDLRALDCLQRVLDTLNAVGDSLPTTPYKIESLSTVILEKASLCDGIAAPTVELRRGRATVPLAGLHVPFHSSQLRPMMEPFRKVLVETFEDSRMNPAELIGKYIPNLTGKPFAVDRQYFEEVLERTGSNRIREILDHWEDYWGPRIKAESEMLHA